ncbi:MAG: 4-(cytidine 5'-diphospho)-2-C-methyl-D-erythritol kinase [Planctomycetota bacterium]|nr:4-(cytidine 5'-diphospho)-2-C-methyl-D-erythritol kinase [Planctomycetota bacterium]
MTLNAPAKINLNLLVGPPRSDGYHPIDSYVARITLCDTVELAARDDARVTIECLGADCGPGPSNLAYRAAAALAGLPGKKAPGVDIRLTKRIPPGAGLGGGSSDAATVLMGLNRLWGLDLSPAALASVAAGLGSDVPLFLGPPAVRMTGRGEIVQPAEVFDFWSILCLPALHVPTPAVYRQFDALPAVALTQLDGAILAGPPSAWRGRLVNQLTPAAHAVCPALDAWRDQLARLRLPVCLSGSGAAMFILFDDETSARSAMESLGAPVRDVCQVVQLSPV